MTHEGFLISFLTVAECPSYTAVRTVLGTVCPNVRTCYRGKDVKC